MRGAGVSVVAQSSRLAVIAILCGQLSARIDRCQAVQGSLPVVLMGSRLPPRLADLADPPAALYVRGELPRGPCVAVVGTRRATPDALCFAKELAAELVRAGVSILSGGARGIDTAAHRGALAAGGTTLVMAPAGFAVPYPPENAALFRRVIAAGGGYAALVPDDQPATQAAFFRRNACLVALAHAVVVVQAGYRSGARNAAAQARHLGRPVFAVPFAPWRSKGRGCLAELRAGAALCEDAGDVLSELERLGCQLVPTARKKSRRRRVPGLEAPHHAVLLESEVPMGQSGMARDSEELSAERRVLEALESGARHADQIAAEAGLSASTTQQVLLTLRLRGVLVCDPTGQLALRKCSD
jgi:DNA processing protein